MPEPVGAWIRTLLAGRDRRPAERLRRRRPGERALEPGPRLRRERRERVHAQRLAPATGRDAVAEVDHAVAETAFVQQLEVQPDVVGQRPLAAPHHDRRDEQVALVDQPGPERLRGKLGTTYGDVAVRPIAFSCRTASGSKSRSIRVLALETASSVLE